MQVSSNQKLISYLSNVVNQLLLVEVLTKKYLHMTTVT